MRYAARALFWRGEKNSMPTPLEKDVYTPLAYFAYFGYPLTAFEIWKWQYRPSRGWSYEEIERTLKTSYWIRQHVSSYQNFFALGDTEGVTQQVIERKQRYNDATRKERKLKWLLRYVKHIPGLRAAALCNSMPLHFTRPESDIDLFLITNPGAIWSVRFVTVSALALLRQRPGEAKKHPIDASFFVTTNAIDLSELRLRHDPYFSYWLATLTPVLGDDDVWRQFFDANTWVLEDLPNAVMPQRAYRARTQNMRPLPIHMPEQWLRGWQLKRLPQDLLEQKNATSRVVITDDVLKFHRLDRRQEIAEAFFNRLSVCKNLS